VAAAEFERPNEVEMTKAVTIYGIKNCDTMKKARAWLDQRGVAYGFHDYKSAGIDRGMLERWARATGWETLLNRAGTTFRKRPEKDKAQQIQRPVYYISEVLSTSKQNYPHYQKMCYGVYMSAKRLKPYFQAHPITVVSSAPLADIMGSKEATG